MEESTDKAGNSGCSEYLEILHLMLDNEATKEQENYLSAHVDKCMTCLQLYEVEKEIRILIKTKLTSQSVPPGLASEIRRKIFKSA
ncbi:MAG: hypothetical protein RIA62_02960 [Cyclobacteriaceae bacterium]